MGDGGGGVHFVLGVGDYDYSVRSQILRKMAKFYLTINLPGNSVVPGGTFEQLLNLFPHNELRGYYLSSLTGLLGDFEVITKEELFLNSSLVTIHFRLRRFMIMIMIGKWSGSPFGLL